MASFTISQVNELTKMMEDSYCESLYLYLDSVVVNHL